MRRRSRVEVFEEIRRDARLDPSLSVRQLAKRHGVHRRAVRQALVSAVPLPRKVYANRPRPAIDPWVEVIDSWLIADQSVAKKQRHTARRVWQRLIAEHGASLAEVTVSRYVGRRRVELGLVNKDVFVPQTHPRGAEAEVDFGEFDTTIAGSTVRLWMFVMRLSHSGRAFHVAYGTQAQEAFLQGHVEAFAHFGGVPGRVRYDNPKPAVTRVLRGRNRDESDRFTALRSHYSLTELTGGSLQVRRGVSLLDDMAVRGHGASHGGFGSCRAAGSSGWVAARNRAGGSALRAGRPDWTGRCCGGGVLR